MKKYAVITFLFNHYDLLREPIMADEKVDYYCLTDDKNLKSDVWQIIYLEKMDTDKLTGVQKTYMTKYSFYKYIPIHYEYFICIDGSIRIKNRLSEVLDFFNKNKYDIAIGIHCERCKYIDEYNAWKKYRSLKDDYINKFEQYCKDNKISSNEETGIMECTVKVFKNSEIVIELIENIYNTLLKYCNFADANDQCYFTNEYKKYDDKLKLGLFYRQFFAGSKYLDLHYHKSTCLCPNKFIKEKINKNLFGKEREILEF